jgi:predicted GIY-YIG superfamily endonuclease
MASRSDIEIGHGVHAQGNLAVWTRRYGGLPHANNIQSEKRLKKRNRAWKISLIKKINLNWIDLFSGIASP